LSKGLPLSSGVALLAGLDYLFGFAESEGVDENDVMLFGGGVEEVAAHA